MPFMYNSATADLGILEGRLTAARAAALDELLAANIPTDLANNLAAIGLVETEAAAAARDVLVHTDLMNIEADTAGIAGAAMRGTDGVDVAAMRGTDNAFLAANYLGLQFTPYSYNTELANGAQFIPPAKTIVLNAVIEVACTAEQDFYFFQNQVDRPTIDAFNQSWEKLPTANAVGAPMYCDGTSGFEQNTGGAENLLLLGLTMQ